jgi:sulfite exporter TauE/SafE
MNEILQSFFLGFLGSLHCAGMCGPIALALPVDQKSWGSRIAGSLLYNTGRTLTYGVLGLLLGIAGAGLFLWGIQQWVSIAVGSVMVLWVLVSLLSRRIISINSTGISSRITAQYGKWFSKRTYFSVLVIGFLNGLLPCGLVYVAMANALVSPSPAEGALRMIFFGLGTIPMMLSLTLTGNFLGLRFRNRIQKIIPWFVMLIGLLFILRGLNLGIPYISPKMDPQTEKTECCHGK